MAMVKPIMDTDTDIMRLLAPHADDLWIKRRLQMDELIDGLEEKLTSDWRLFLAFLANECSGKEFSNDRQWGELLNLMGISRILNQKSVKLKDIIKSRSAIEANAKLIRQLNQSARLCQLIERSIKELESSLGSVYLDLSVLVQDDNKAGALETSNRLLLGQSLQAERHLRGTCRPLLATLQSKLDNELLKTSSSSQRRLDEWRQQVLSLEATSRLLSNFLTNLQQLERNLAHLSPLVKSIDERNVGEGCEGSANGEQQQPLDDSLANCMRDFRRILRFRHLLISFLLQQSSSRPQDRRPTQGQRTSSGGNQRRLQLVRLLNLKQQFVEPSLCESELCSNLKLSIGCKNDLEGVMKSLRLEFGRFYFVNDLELLKIIAKDSKLVSECHLAENKQLISKLFNGSICSFVLSKGNSSDKLEKIIGVESPLGEQVALFGEEPVPLVRHRLSVYSVEIVRILNELGRKLRRSLRNLLDASLMGALSGLDSPHVDWSLPLQLMDLAEEVKFTRRVESALASGAKLEPLLEFYEQRFRDLSSAAKGHDDDDYDCHMLKHSAALSLTVHFMSTLLNLIQSKVERTTDWSWLQLTRHYFTGPNEPLQVRLAGNFRLYYKFDYLPLEVDSSASSQPTTSQRTFKRLIETETSVRCFLAAGQAIGRLKLGASPFGPAGSGKTETVKALGRALGCQVIVHNCDQSNTPDSLNRLVWGLARAGLWGCFDEFNRLSSSALSSVSATLELVQLGLRRKQNTVELPDGQLMALDPTSAFFVTLNPGDELKYRGRRQLPANLRALFLPIAMTRVQIDSIASELLLGCCSRQPVGSIGEQLNASKSRELAQKLARWIELMSSSPSPANNRCEWDLRLVMAVLRRLRPLLSSTEQTGCSLDELLVESINRELEPRLNPMELQFLRKNLGEIFRFGAVDSRKPPDADRSSLEARLRELTEVNETVEKCTQLHELLKTRTGVILMGPPRSGKTTCWRRLHQALQSSTRWFALNPRACSKDELFGHFVEPLGGNKWVDGQLTRVVREGIELLQSNQGLQQVWIVLDGCIDPDWVECLNSVLDDNQVLTLASGERLSFSVGPQKSLKIIFETLDVELASPATISRLGLVLFASNIQQTLSASRDLVEGVFESRNGSSLMFASSAKIGAIESRNSTAKFVEYTCSHLSNSSHLVDLLVATNSYSSEDTCYILKGVEQIQAEDKWATRSFWELLRHVSSYGSCYDMQSLDRLEIKAKFLVALSGQDESLEQVADLRLRSAGRFVFASPSRELTRPEEVQTVDSVADILESDTCNLSTVLTVTNCEPDQREQILSSFVVGLHQRKVFDFCSSDATSKSLEALKKLIEGQDEFSGGADAKQRPVFILNEHELLLLDKQTEAQLYHLLNILKIQRPMAIRLLHFSSDSSPGEAHLWRSLGPIFEFTLKQPTRKLFRDILSSKLEAQLSRTEDLDWILEKVELLFARNFIKDQRSLHGFLSIVVELIDRSKASLQGQRRSLSTGLDCLGKFEASVEAIKRQRSDEGAELVARRQEVSSLMGQLDLRLANSREQSHQMEELRRKQAIKTAEVEKKRQGISLELEQVSKQVEASRREVQRCLKPEALNEIKTLRAPPKTIKDILDVLMILLGVADTSWTSVKSYLTRSSLRDELASYDFDKRLNRSLLSRVESEIRSRGESFSPAQSARASSAIVPIVNWIEAARNYGQVLIRLRPLRDELEKLEAESQEIRATMERIEAEQIKLKESIDSDSERLQRSREEFEEAQRRSDRVQIDLERAQKVRENLTDQANRWTEKLDRIEELSRGRDLLKVCLLATSMALHFADEMEQLGEFAELFELPTKMEEELLARVLHLVDEDNGAVELQLTRPEEGKQIVLLVVLRLYLILRSWSKSINSGLRLPFLSCPSQLSEDELLNYLSFKRILCRPNDLSIVRIQEDSTSWRQSMELSLRINKLLVIDLHDSSPSQLLDALHLLHHRASGGRVLLIGGGSCGQRQRELARLFRCIEMARGEQRSVDDIKRSLVSGLIEVNSPQLAQAARELELDLERKRHELRQLEGNLLRRLTGTTNSTHLAPSPIRAVTALQGELVQILGELHQVSEDLRESISQLESKLAEHRQEQSRCESIAQRAATFYEKYLANESDPFARLPLGRFLRLLTHLSPISSGGGSGLSGLERDEIILARAMRPMRAARRREFCGQLVARGASHLLFGARADCVDHDGNGGETRPGGEALATSQLAELTQRASRRAASLRGLFEEELERAASGVEREDFRLVALAHEPRRASPQVELDELFTRWAPVAPFCATKGGTGNESGANAQVVSYCKLYATDEPTTSASTGCPGKLELELTRILSACEGDERTGSGETGNGGAGGGNKWLRVHCICLASAHLAVKWINARLLELLKAATSGFRRSHRLALVILVGEAPNEPDLGRWFDSNLLEAAHAKQWHDELSLSLAERHNLLIGLLLVGRWKALDEQLGGLVEQLILFHVVCQELSRGNVGSAGGWLASYSFDFEQLCLALRMLEQILEDSKAGAAGAGAEAEAGGSVGEEQRQQMRANLVAPDLIRTKLCKLLANVVYGARMETVEDELRLAGLIERFLASAGPAGRELAKLRQLLGVDSTGGANGWPGRPQANAGGASERYERLLANLINSG